MKKILYHWKTAWCKGEIITFDFITNAQKEDYWIRSTVIDPSKIDTLLLPYSFSFSPPALSFFLFLSPFLHLSLSSLEYSFFTPSHWMDECYLLYRPHLPTPRSSINWLWSPYQTTDAGLTRFFAGRRGTDLNKPLPGGISHRQIHTSDEFWHSFLADVRSEWE